MINHIDRYFWVYGRLSLLLVGWQLVTKWGLPGGVLIPAGLMLAWEVMWVVAWAVQRSRALQLAGRDKPSPARLAVMYCQDRWLLFWVKRHYNAACHEAKIENRGGYIPDLRQATPTIDGDVEAVIRPTRVQLTVGDVAKHQTRIQELTHCKGLQITPRKDVGSAFIKFYKTDPLERTLPISLMPVTKFGIAYGVRIDGKAATIEWDKSLLIGGLTGAGKSSLLWALFCDMIRQGLLNADLHVRLWVSDPKGGIELDALEKSVGQLGGTFQVERYVRNAADTVTMVNAFEKAMRVRQRELKEAGIRKHTLSARFPLMILVLDELLPLHQMLKQGTASTFGQVLFEGRAAGFIVYANAQVGHASELGTLRNLFPQRVCFGMPTPQATDTILGDGAEARGASCSLLGQNLKANAGVGFSVDENGRLAKFRCAFVSDKPRRGGSDIERISTGKLPKGTITQTAEAYTAQQQSYALYQIIGVLDCDRGRILYDGITNDVRRRMGEHHRRDYGWCPICEQKEFYWAKHCTPAIQADRAAGLYDGPTPDRPSGGPNTPIVWLKDEPSARVAEKTAIEDDEPVFNVIHNTSSGHLSRRARAVVRRRSRAKFLRKNAAPVQPSREPKVRRREPTNEELQSGEWEKLLTGIGEDDR